MVSTVTPAGQLGMKAPDFDLAGVDGRRHTLASARGPNGILVMFICNHCPYVKAVIDKIVRDTAELAAQGIGSIAISSNDPADYPDDSFENMKAFAARHRMASPYAFDESQDVAKSYGAVCTPDFFGFDRELTLAYRGRLDASGRSADPAAPRELYTAMVEIARGGNAPATQNASIGCSIKWRRP
ncbi:MAG: thioredoxin family protein [Betaproteobacteria bacterium]